MFEKNYKISRFLLCMMFTLLLSPQSVFAKNYFETKITPEEQAVFSFFRAADVAPNYDFWIMSRPEYKALSSAKQETYLLKELLRLGRGYGLHDRDKDLLELRINVSAKYISAADGNEPRIAFRLLNASEAYIPTFNYPYGYDTISLVINRLAIFSNISLTEEQNETLLKKIPYKDEFFDATLNVHVRVSHADTENPIRKRNGTQWLMVGEIAYLKCEADSYYSGQKHMLWDYVAPWHEEGFRLKNMPEEEKYPHPFDLYKD